MRIDWTSSAFIDLHRVRDYISQSNPVAAQRTVASIEAAAKNLTRFPDMGRIGEEPGTRELIIHGLPYFVVYRIRDDAVQVLRVLHDKQKWPPES